MFYSKSTDKCLLLILVMLISGCASITNILDSDKSTEQSQPEVILDQNEAVLSDSHVEQESPLVEFNDPMKVKTYPAELLKKYRLVENLLNNNENQKAIELLNQLQLDYVDLSGPSYRLARIYRKLNDYDNALKAVDKSIMINPDNYYAINLKGILLREKGLFKQSKLAYQQALEIFPQYVNCHLNLAILADIYLQEHQLAMKHYQHYLSLNKTEDKKVSGWLIDLKRRIPKGV